MPGEATTAPDASLLARDMALHAGEAAALLKALAHPARLLVLCQLVQGERTVGELQPATGLGASALSQHLAVLRDMALQCPETLAELGTIPGVGVKKLETWGPDFIAVVREHLSA